MVRSEGGHKDNKKKGEKIERWGLERYNPRQKKERNDYGKRRSKMDDKENKRCALEKRGT